MKVHDDVSLADLIRALGALHPTSLAARDAIANALGFSPDVRAPPSLNATAACLPTAADARAQPAPKPARHAAGTSKDVHASAPRIGVLRHAGVGTTPMWLNAPPLEGEIPALARAPAVEFEPLFKRNRTREILRYSVAVRVSEGAVDAAALSRSASKLRPLVKMPRKPRLVVRRGVQVLIDVDDGMAPYADDQARLVEEIKKLIGDALVQTVSFRRTPLRRPRRTPDGSGYRPPEFGASVLILSDFGIATRGGRATLRESMEWAEFGHILERRGSRVLFLVPHPSERWQPLPLSKAHYAEWNDKTTVMDLYRELHRSY
jgi:hypothetical protein